MCIGLFVAVSCACFSVCFTSYIIEAHTVWFVCLYAMPLPALPQSVADSLASQNADPCVTWTRQDALERCVKFDVWTKEIPLIIQNALIVRRSAMREVSRCAAFFSYTLSWDPALVAIPACCSFKLPRSSHLVFKLRYMVEVLLRLKFAGQEGDVYDRESSLLALRSMTLPTLREWKKFLEGLPRLGKDGIDLLVPSTKKRVCSRVPRNLSSCLCTYRS